MLGPHRKVLIVKVRSASERTRAEALAERPADRAFSRGDGIDLCFDMDLWSDRTNLLRGKLMLFDIRSDVLVCL